MKPISDFYWDKSLALGDETAALTRLVWPRFLVEPSDRPDDGLRSEIAIKELAKRFLVWGLRQRFDSRLIAYAYAVVIEIESFHLPLPETGWDFASRKVFEKDQSPNCTCLMAANIDPSFRALGLSAHLLAEAKRQSLCRGFSRMIAPVRPVQKAQFPNEPMDTYVNRRTTDGQIFDSWLRTHVEAGAEIGNICDRSVTVVATLPWWRERVDNTLNSDGYHLVDDALTPIEVDLRNNLGSYTEPNVWVRYEL